MKLIKFPEHNVVYAENQPEYLPLPAHRVDDDEGTIICCWKLTWRERFKVLFSGLIWHRIFNFQQATSTATFRSGQAVQAGEII